MYTRKYISSFHNTSATLRVPYRKIVIVALLIYKFFSSFGEKLSFVQETLFSRNIMFNNIASGTY